MAETGYTPIQLYRSATASAAPTAGNLLDGELALNTNDGKLYYKNSGGSVAVLADGALPGTGTVTSVGGTGTVNGISLSGTVTTSGNLTLGGALSGVNLTSQVTGVLPVANGGTALASLGTAGQVLTVNSGGSAVEYATPAAGGISAGLSIALAMVMGF
tara:strand:+ start:7111 stop:7587 length:477 start_codon:yes stop_codon:yes gene_type:complete